MTYAEMSETINSFIDEYFSSGKHGGWLDTKEEEEGYRQRLKKFFSENDVPNDLDERFVKSGVGQSFYMAHGYGILE